MEMLIDAGISLAKYKPTENGIGLDPRKTKTAKAETTASTISAPHSEPASTPDSDSPKQTAWDKRLVSRLAKLTVKGNTTEGRAWVRNILKKNGYSDLTFKDELQAVAIFQRLNISIDGFEYENKPGTPGGPLFAPPATTIDELRAQYLDAMERTKKLMEDLTTSHARGTQCERKLSSVRTMLLQCEKQIKLAWIAEEIAGITKPLEYAISALNELR
jgi:hypothetical protein